jgi:hypothetical protein
MLSGMFGCKINSVLSPSETVPSRSTLVYDAFGGYITVKTSDSVRYAGELIGMRNDSLIVLGDSLSSISTKNISGARVVVYSPNKYGAGFLFAIPNLFLFGVSGDDIGGGPAILALYLTSFNVMGTSMAIGTENGKKNYYDLSDGWKEVIKYSRFPYEIPPTLKLSELKKKYLPPANR